MSEHSREFYTEGVESNLINFGFWKDVITAERQQCQRRKELFYPPAKPEIPAAQPHIKLIDSAYDPSLDTPGLPLRTQDL